MTFSLGWTRSAEDVFARLQAEAERSPKSKSAGLFKQVAKSIRFLAENPRHPSLKTHEYDSLEHPFDPKRKVWEAYAQNKTPGAYRIFWCYGPNKGQITIIAITPHP